MINIKKNQEITIKKYGKYIVVAVTGYGSDEKSSRLQKIGKNGRILRSGKNSSLNLSDKELNCIGYTNGEEEIIYHDGYDIASLQAEIKLMAIA